MNGMNRDAKQAPVVKTTDQTVAKSAGTVVQANIGETVNHNKPWRVVIRRNVTDGGSGNEDISRDIIDN